jgi:hypothetical protein
MQHAGLHIVPGFSGYDRNWNIQHVLLNSDRLCGLVVRVPGCRPRGLGYDSRRYQISWVVLGLERASLSLVSINEELR